MTAPSSPRPDAVMFDLECLLVPQPTIGDRGFSVAPDALHVIQQCREAGVCVGVTLADRGAERVLQAAGVRDLFDVIVGETGTPVAGPGTHAGPSRYPTGCGRLWVDPPLTTYITRASAGALAAVAGGYGRVVGVAAGRKASELYAAGAEVVVRDFSELTVVDGELCPHSRALRRRDADPWNLRYFDFQPTEEGTREALCTLANGYWGVRGASSSAAADGVHYPGTYFAGVYDAVRVDANGAESFDEEMVNAPNWLPLNFRADGAESLRVEEVTVLRYFQELDLKRGVLTRAMVVRDSGARITWLRSLRLVSQDSPRLAAERHEIVALNWEGHLTIQSNIDAEVSNSNAPGHSPAAHRHLVHDYAGPVGRAGVFLQVKTRISGVHIAIAARIDVSVGGRPVESGLNLTTDESEPPSQTCTVPVARAQTICVDKIVAASTSRDRAVMSPRQSATAELLRAPEYAAIRKNHVRAWRRQWALFDVRVLPAGRTALAVHLNIFHVLQSLARSSTDVDAGVPARGLHGEGYDGHIFWDELFVYPMLTLRSPGDARALLEYRYRRLPEARAAAREMGKAGAMFPWQSGIDGSEVTPRRLLNPRTGRWIPDNSRRQRHVGLAVAFSAWQFFESTDDRQFLIDEGAELICDVARFFASLATYNKATDRYSICQVMGPDEFHDAYPGRGPGVNDNVYTNVLSAWVLRRAIDVTRLLRLTPTARDRRHTEVTDSELSRWEHIARRLTVVFNADGTLSQFAGYDDLAPIDLTDYATRYGPIGRLDLILNAENDSPNNYQVSKQPDCLMLLYLLSAEELRLVVQQMGYDLSADVIRRTVDRYTATSTYGSTLSNVVHSWIEARRDRTQSWTYLLRALNSDLADLQGGTTREGVHIAAMAGSIDLLTRCYAGLETRSGRLWLHPQLPAEISQVRFTLVYREHRLRIRTSHSQLWLRSAAGIAAPILVVVNDKTLTLRPGESVVVGL